MNKVVASLIALTALLSGGRFPWPETQVQASQLELCVTDRGQPLPGVEVTRTVFASLADKPRVQIVKTDGFGKCLFTAVKVRSYIHVIGEYNFVQKFTFSLGRRRFAETQLGKPNCDDLGETVSYSVPPQGMTEIKRLENRIRVTVELSQLRAE